MATGTRFTVMPSTGDVILCGKVSDGDTTAFHRFRNTSAGLVKHGTMLALCKHKESNFILPLLKDNQELLTVSCWWCHRIRLYNVNNGHFSTALNDRKNRPGFICSGEDGYIYTVGDVNGSVQIYRVNYAENQFQICDTIQTSLKKYYGMCYIKGTKLIAVSNWRESLVSAVCCRTGVTVWEMKGEVDGVEYCPCTVVYSPGHQALLVADGPNCRILVLNPKDGSLKQVIGLSKNMGGIVEMCVHENKVVVIHCEAGDRFKISSFSLGGHP